MFGSNSPDEGKPQEVVRKAPTIQVVPITKMPPPLPPNSMHDMRVDKLSRRMDIVLGDFQTKSAVHVELLEECSRSRHVKDTTGEEIHVNTMRKPSGLQGQGDR